MNFGSLNPRRLGLFRMLEGSSAEERRYAVTRGSIPTLRAYKFRAERYSSLFCSLTHSQIVLLRPIYKNNTMQNKPALKVVYRQVADLIPYARNARTHSDEQVTRIASSIKEFGFTNPILIDGDNGIIAGHGRLMAAKKLGMREVPTIELSGMTDAQKRAYILADNKLALDAGWDEELLRLEFEELRGGVIDLELTGFGQEEIDELFNDLESNFDYSDPDGEHTGNLRKNYLVPPFSLLDSTKIEWKDRVKQWENLGLDSGKGRKESLLGNGGMMDTVNSGTSIFDPVLCELLYLWFTPKGATIVDPFSGGSVRGIVASKLGRNYFGNDLRLEQINENRKQAEYICKENIPVWTVGDSQNILNLMKGVEADFVFSCPPYADLEVYSDNPNDLSTMEYKEFLTAYRKIIADSCSMLKNDRFACFVVGEVRDKNGNYLNFVADTIQAFIDAGLSYYNEIILMNSIGTLPLRAGKAFTASRKIGKRHQNVLVFVKGDAKKATRYCGSVELPDMGKLAEEGV